MPGKPHIAISTQFESEPERFSLRREYVEMVEEAGGLPSIIPAAYDAASLQEVLIRFDGLLIPGGDDIDPRTYGCTPLASHGRDAMRFDPERDRAERDLIIAAERLDMPFLGICRGMQMANVAYGGTLVQDIPSCIPGSLDHWQHADASLASHAVDVVEKSRLSEVIGRRRIRVNSLHHQCIEELGAGCVACAFSEDGLVEALCRPSSSYFLGVQWHPESNRANESSRAIANSFVAACAQYARSRRP